MVNIKKNITTDEEFDLICEYIKLRNESKLSQNKLAEKVGIARSTIARMENNLHSMSLGTFIKILSELNYKLKIVKKKGDNNETR